MVDDQTMDWVTQVMKVFWEADAHEGLWWRVEEGIVTLWAVCSDVFYYSASDLEEITAEDVPLLEEALADLQAHDGGSSVDGVGLLYAARKRQRRPTDGWFAMVSHGGLPDEVLAMYQAAGPQEPDDL